MRNILIISLITLIGLNSCNSKQYYKIQGFTQGTTYAITYEGSKDYEVEINDLLHQFDISLSTYVDSSIISRINRNENNVEIDELFKQFFEKSREVYEKSNGFFDITVAPLVNAYGFGFSKKENVDSAFIDSLMGFVGMGGVWLRNGKIVKSDPRIMLDGNAIAQGQSVDFIADFLEKEGVTNYLVEIGGEIHAKGVNDRGEVWRVGIDKPIEGSDEQNRSLQAIIQLKNKSLATSGNYRKFYEKDGVKYGHSINPKTGYPAMHSILSATIVADDCMTADAYATTCMVIGLENSKILLSKMKDLDAYLIYADPNDGSYKVFMTDGIKDMIE
ncbi:MAG: FAD:protein FMN transferase [Bacteroidota bacterium]